MPPRQNKAKANGEDMRLSQREVEIVAVAWCSVKSIKDGKPVVDMNQFVAKGQYKTADSASHCWRRIEKKLLNIADALKTGNPGNGDGESAAPAPGPSTPVKAKGALGKRKAQVISDSDGDDDADAEEGGEGGGARKSRRTGPKAGLTTLPRKKTAGGGGAAKVKKATAVAAAKKRHGARAKNVAGKDAEDGEDGEEGEESYNEFDSFSEVGDGEA